MSNRIKCILTDDEPFARKGLQGYVAQIDFLDLRGICENALELNSLLKKEPVDLLFPRYRNALAHGHRFPQTTGPRHPASSLLRPMRKYAVQGFELEVLDYLLKPISFDRFLKAANKAFDYFRQQQAAAPAQDYIFVKADNRLEKISFAEILFAEALENYVAIYTRERKIITHL